MRDSFTPGWISVVGYNRGAPETVDAFLEFLPTAEVSRRGVKWVDRFIGSPTHALRVFPTEGKMQKAFPALKKLDGWFPVFLFPSS